MDGTFKGAYKGYEMVRKDQGLANQAKVKEMVGKGFVRLLGELVLHNHGARRSEVSDDYSSKDNKDILGDAAPRRVAGPKKHGLLDTSRQPVAPWARGRTSSTYMVLHHMHGGETPTSEKRRQRHFAIFHENDGAVGAKKLIPGDGRCERTK